MRTVRTDDGEQYLLVKQSSESSLVRDPDTGAERYVPNADLTVDTGAPPLTTAAGGVPASVRRVLTATPNDRALGLLVELADRGPLPVRTLLDAYDLCESDLHGLLAEFRAAGLVDEARVAGERGYDATATTRDAIALLREEEPDD
ncbi:DUF7346 family protein [Haloplanus halobius]|uniref:DUF7346 family protein n=1 Tax=Haloplanus halobius TaxID=2934938 RepID=UPI002010563A|nr:hypothetical protein [Haloplanus sp. XH21]